MKTEGLALLLVILAMGCLSHRDQLQYQDTSIQMLGYDSIMEGEPIDGSTLRALQVAANDFFPASAVLRACIDTPEAHRYHAVRRGEVIYVAIIQDPSYCGREHSSLDPGVRYAISVDGRILRRLLDGEPDVSRPEEQGGDPVFLDGGASDINVSIQSSPKLPSSTISVH